MPDRREFGPGGDPDYYKFTVKVPRGGEDPFRDLFKILFEGEGEIIYDQQREELKKRELKAFLDGKIADFLAPKDPEIEVMIGKNLMRMFTRIFETPKTTITAFYLETIEEIRQAKKAFHELCPKKRISLRKEVIWLELHGVIDGLVKTRQELGLINHVSQNQIGSLERQVMRRLSGGLNWNAQSYSDLIPAVLELREKPV